MTSPIRLSVDPRVALVGYRFPAESPEPGEQLVHDVALMLGEPVQCPAGHDAIGRHEARVDGARVVCRLCRVVLRWWQCDCGDSTFRERPCRHIQESIRLYAEERKAHR